MSRCTDIVVTWVLCNLIVIGFLMLFCSWNLAGLRQSVPPSVDFNWPYCQEFGVWLTAS